MSPTGIDSGWRPAAAYADVLAAEEISCARDVLERSETVRELPDRSNHVLQVGGLRLFVKRHRHGRVRRLARSPEVQGIERLQAAGVRTAPVVFEAVDRKAGALAGTLDLAPARPLDALLEAGALTVPARRAVLFDLARQVGALHDARLHHRDLYLNHVFVDPSAAVPCCYLIDAERVASHRRLQVGRWVVKDLAALKASTRDGWVTPGEQHRFLLAYLAARHMDGDVWVEPIVTAVLRKAERIRAHAPRTPVGEAARPGARPRA